MVPDKENEEAFRQTGCGRGGIRFMGRLLPVRAESAAVILVLAAGLILSRGLFQPGILLSGDNAVHQAESAALMDIVLAQQAWWSGWYEGDFAGYPLLVYQYPLGKWLVALLGSIPGTSIGAAYKPVLFFSWLFPVLVLVHLLGRRGYSLLSLSAVSMFYLTCFDGYLLSLAGMWNQYLSAGLFLIALDSILKLLESGSPGRLFLAAFWTSLAAVSHQFMLILLPIAWLAVMAVRTRESKYPAGSLYALMFLPILSFCMSAWYFVPIFMTRDWPEFVAHPVEWYSICSSLFPMVSSDLLRAEGVSVCGNPMILLYSLGMVAALIAGSAGLVRAVSGTFKRQAVDPLFPVAAGMLLSVGVLILLVLWEPLPFLRLFTFSVGGGRLALYLLLPLMILSALVIQPRPLPGGGGNRSRIVPVLVLISLLPNLIWAATSRSFPLPELLYMETSGDSRTREKVDLDEIFAWLRTNASPEEGRILYQDTAYNCKNHPLYWSHLMAMGRSETGLWGLGGSGQLFVPTDPLTRTQGEAIFGTVRSRITSEELAANMKLFNCRWALTCEPELEALFSASRGVEPVLRRGRFALFKNSEEGQWVEIVEGKGKVRMKSGEDGRRVMEADIHSGDGALVLVKSSYHPWWNITAKGVEITAEKDYPDHLLRFRLPNKGSYEVVLEFRPPRLLPLMLTFLGFAGAGLLMIFRRG